MEKETAKIGKNNPCPCGSGKKYRRCCKGKGIRYAFFEHGSVQFAYNLDAVNAHLGKLSNFCYHHIITPFNNQQTVDDSSGLKLLVELYAHLDNVLAPFLANSACKKGCKECCNLVVETTPIEADLVGRFIKKNIGGDTLVRMAARIKETGDHYADPALLGARYAHLKVERYLHSTLRCPFFTKKYTCAIYPVRPLGCRTHIVYSSPQQCRTRKTIDYYDGGYFPHIYKALECLSAMVHPHIPYEKHLPDWFLEEFKI